MNVFLLVKKSLFKSFEKELIKYLFLPYFVLCGGDQILLLLLQKPTGSNLLFFFNSIIFLISNLFLLFGPLLYFPILIDGLNAIASNEIFIFPKIKIIFKKAWKIFLAGLITFTIILIGTIFFIIPGVFLAKRYIYVPFIINKEMIGPFDAMRKSRQLSERNGWYVILSYLLSTLIFLFFLIPLIFIDPSLNSNSILSIQLTTLIGIILGWFMNITFNSITYYGFLNAEKFNS